MKNLKKRYEELSKKYNLPSYDELDKEFEILYIREVFEISKPLAYVRRRLSDKLGGVCGMLQSLIQPNPNSSVSIEESSFFSKDEKQKLVKLLKELMYYERLSVHLDVNSEEEKDAEFIKEASEKWNEVKPKVESITGKLKDGWQKEVKAKAKNHHYMG
tara:strand:- start:4852 stop:5328 length:477 start_codon:yes stop_codon:yes gene_type:complete